MLVLLLVVVALGYGLRSSRVEGVQKDRPKQLDDPGPNPPLEGLSHLKMPCFDPNLSNVPPQESVSVFSPSYE